MNTVHELIRSQDGASMIEYALLAALVSIAALAALQALGPAVLGLYQAVAAAVGGA